MTSGWSLSELKEAVKESYRNTYISDAWNFDIRAVVDRRFPEVAGIRKNIKARQDALKQKYGHVLPQQMSPGELEERNTLKTAWEKDYNLMQQRDWERVYGNKKVMLTTAAALGSAAGTWWDTRKELAPARNAKTVAAAVGFLPVGYFTSIALHKLFQELPRAYVLTDEFEVKQLKYVDVVTPEQLRKDRFSIFASVCAAGALFPFTNLNPVLTPDRGFIGNLRACTRIPVPRPWWLAVPAVGALLAAGHPFGSDR